MSIQSKLQSHLLTKLVNFRWVEKRLPQLLVIVLEQKVRAKEHSYQVREKKINYWKTGNFFNFCFEKNQSDFTTYRKLPLMRLPRYRPNYQ